MILMKRLSKPYYSNFLPDFINGAYQFRNFVLIISNTWHVSLLVQKKWFPENTFRQEVFLLTSVDAKYCSRLHSLPTVKTTFTIHFIEIIDHGSSPTLLLINWNLDSIFGICFKLFNPNPNDMLQTKQNIRAPVCP